jgi:hypothetical protein
VSPTATVQKPAPCAGRLPLLAAALVAAAFGPAPARTAEAPVQWEFASGVDVSTGTYGSALSTDIVYVPFTARFKGQHWRWDVTVPWLRLEGPANVVGGSGAPIVTDPTASGLRQASGLGDVVTGLGYMTTRFAAQNLFIETKLRAKLPTARTGLGTGERDVAAQIDLYKVVGERLTLIATGGYQRLGDPAGAVLEDGLLASAGANLKLTPATDLGLVLDHRNRPIATLEDQRSLIPYVSRRLTPAFGVTGYAVLGLTNSSPDRSLGLQLTHFAGR